MQLRRSLAALLVAALVLAPAPGRVLRADESSGRWTGTLELQGNYYWETSTRVIAPEVRGRLTSPDGTDFRVEYLVDAITSASIAAGVTADIRFTEMRNQVTTGIGREIDLGDAQLRLDLSGRISHEPDYLATGVTLSAAASLNQRATVIGLALTYIHDDVGAVIRGEQPRTGGGRNLSDRGRLGELEGITAGVSLSQILTPQLELSLGYDLVHNWGFLQNPYRGVMVEGVVRPERHPGERTRHSGYGRLALFVPETRSSIQALYRAYVDDWSIAAITPEARFYQELGDRVTIRLRYRFYTQTRSYFYRLPEQYRGSDEFVTADPKMSSFHSHLMGMHARVELEFLGGTPLEWLRDGNVWLSFDYLFQTHRFGNAVIAQAAISVPF
jgi:hypothetical protein